MAKLAECEDDLDNYITDKIDDNFRESGFQYKLSSKKEVLIYTKEKEEIKVVFLGCDGSGKTTLLYNLKLGSMISTIPTIGFNVETVERPDFDLSIWDVGGSSKIKALCRHYYEHA